MRANVIAEDIRLRLAQSMPIVERRRAQIVIEIVKRMDPLASPSESLEASCLAAMLFELLIDGGSDIAAFGGLRDLCPAKQEHGRRGISGRHYSRFGTALGPALRAVLGPAMPPKSASAWCDAFWLVVEAINSDEPRKAPSLFARHEAKAGRAGMAS
jgi:hypothetical protein